MKKQAGFTLIELLVVIAIIALLASVVISSLQSARKKARDAQRMSDIQQIQKAIELYKLDNGHAPYIDEGVCYVGAAEVLCAITEFSTLLGADDWALLEDELAPTYIASLPKDPCGDACFVEGISEAGFFAYHYTAPGAFDGAGEGDYQIFAQNLEMRTGPFGVNTLWGGSF